MPRYTYERLSAQDNSFLLMERPTVHMHVAATAIYEAGPLRTADGGIDIGAFKRAVESVLHLIPRYRQKLKWIPYTEQPVWVDDRHFKLDYHIRHTSLPRPGTDEQLKQLGGRITAQQLDRSKPLWEFWVVEGLSGDRFAVISKVHHCMVDGISGVDLVQLIMSVTPEQQLPDPIPYIARPSPSSLELIRDEVLRRVNLPMTLLAGIRDLDEGRETLWQEVVKRSQAVAELLGYAVRAASATPINGQLGPHRRIDWLTMPLEDVKTVRRAFGCTVNDLVLATVAGAVRAYLIRRRVNPNGIDFRVSAPVSVRREEERGQFGNRVSSWIVPLPLAESDPAKRLDAIYQITQRLKKSHQALGVETLMAAAEWAPAQLLSLGSRATSGPINMIVTNVPGPQIPLYLLGAKMLEMFPQVPLLENTGIGVALFSYDGQLFWGFKADPDLVADLPAFVQAIASSFAELKASASIRVASERRADRLDAAAAPEEHVSLAAPRAPKRAGRGRPRPSGAAA